jgi:hypothetical protein
VVFIELKEGSVNEAIVAAIHSGDPDRASELFDKYGEKGIKQAERFIRQTQVSMERSRLIGARSGQFKRGKGRRTIVEAKGKPRYFTAEIETLCSKARRGEYAAEIFDECLMVAAADTTSENKYKLAEFDARLLVLNAFVATDDTSKFPRDLLFAELKKIELIDWRDGFSSIFLIPPLMRPLRTRSFLDLMFGRIRLFCYLDASRFLPLNRKFGTKAGFLSRRRTNQLRTNQGWGTGDYPIFDGRALAYLAGGCPMIMGSMRLQQMAFNWEMSSSVAAEIGNGVSQLSDQKFRSLAEVEGKPGFAEQDLEL